MTQTARATRATRAQLERKIIELQQRLDAVNSTTRARKVWAAYVSMPQHSVNGITLHATEREALIAVLDFGAERETPTDTLDLEAIHEMIMDRAERTGADWYTCPVEVPDGV